MYVIFREIIMPIDIGRDLMHMEVLIGIMNVCDCERLRVSPFYGFAIRHPVQPGRCIVAPSKCNIFMNL